MSMFLSQSPLTQGRELKFFLRVAAAQHGESPLTQGRELKLVWRGVGIRQRRRPSHRGVN